MIIRNSDLLAFAVEHGIEPYRCPACRDMKQTGLSWRYGYDDGSDANYLGYQCQRCGAVHGLSARYIRRRARQQA